MKMLHGIDTRRSGYAQMPAGTFDSAWGEYKLH